MADKISAIATIVKFGVIGGIVGGVAYLGYKIWQIFNPPPPDWSSIWEGNVVKYQHSFMGITTDCLYLDEFLDDIKEVPAENKFLIMCHAIVLDSETPTFLGNVIYVLEHQDDLVLTNYDLDVLVEWEWTGVYEGNVKQYRTVDILGITKYFDILSLFKIHIHSIRDLAIQTTKCYAILINATEVELGNVEYVIRREDELVETTYLPPDPIPDVEGVDYYQADWLWDIRKFYYKQEFIDFLESLFPIDLRWYWACHAFDINGVDTYIGNGLEVIAIKDELPLTVHDVEEEEEPEPVPDPYGECAAYCKENYDPLSWAYRICMNECELMRGVGSIMISEPSPEEPPPIIVSPSIVGFEYEPESIIIYEPSPEKPPSVIDSRLDKLEFL